MLWVPPMLLAHARWLAPSRLARDRDRRRRRRSRSAALTDRLVPLAARAARSPRCVGARRLRGRPRARLDADHPLAARRQPALRARASTASATSSRRRSPVLLLVGLGALLMRRADASRAAPSAAIVGARAVLALARRWSAARAARAPTSAASSRSAPGIAVAAVLLLPGGPSRRAIVLALCVAGRSPLVGLALLDLATGGDGHFTRTVLDADSARRAVGRRRAPLQLAFNVAACAGAMPFVDASSRCSPLAVRACATASASTRRCAGRPAWTRGARRRARGGGRRRALQRLGPDAAASSAVVLAARSPTCGRSAARGRPRRGRHRDAGWPHGARVGSPARMPRCASRWCPRTRGRIRGA